MRSREVFTAQAMCRIECKGSCLCAPVAVCRSISNGDQQLCIKLEDQY